MKYNIHIYISAIMIVDHCCNVFNKAEKKKKHNTVSFLSRTRRHNTHLSFLLRCGQFVFVIRAEAPQYRMMCTIKRTMICVRLSQDNILVINRVLCTYTWRTTHRSCCGNEHIITDDPTRHDIIWCNIREYYFNKRHDFDIFSVFLLIKYQRATT